MAGNVPPPPNIAAMMTEQVRERLSIMTQDVNGEFVYSNNRALFGFVPVSQYLMLPEAFVDGSANRVTIGTKTRDFPSLGLDVIGGLSNVREHLGGSSKGLDYTERTTYLYYASDLLGAQISFMNYLSLRNGGLDAADAFVVASLRARWVALGAANLSLHDTNRAFHEHVSVKADGAGDELEQISAAEDLEEVFEVNMARAAEFFAEADSETHGIKWVINNAEIIWCAEEYVMRTRGHHYKPAFDEVLRKYVSACHEGNDNWPRELSMTHVFRTSIHPFGLHALPVLAGHFAVHGKVGNAGLLRFSGAPNGLAVVTTTAACLRAMSGEPWYKQFKMLYGPQVELLEAMETAVLSNKFGFHMSSRLYGALTVTSVVINGATYTVDAIREAGANLAALAQGFVSAMKSCVASGSITQFSFSNAAAMEKFSSVNPLATLRIRNLILFTIDAIGEAKSVKAAASAALPQLEADKAAITGG